MLLEPGEKLGVSLELNNKFTQVAILLTDREYTFLGWTPRYLVRDLLLAISQKPMSSEEFQPLVPRSITH